MAARPVKKLPSLEMALKTKFYVLGWIWQSFDVGK
jgi:hypothetical protein